MKGTDARTIFTYVILGLIAIGLFIVIQTTPTTIDPETGKAILNQHVQEWALMSLIVGYLIRDTAGASATSLIERINASQPTTTTTVQPGPPATATTTTIPHEERDGA